MSRRLGLGCPSALALSLCIALPVVAQDRASAGSASSSQLRGSRCSTRPSGAAGIRSPARAGADSGLRPRAGRVATPRSPPITIGQIGVRSGGCIPFGRGAAGVRS